MSIYGSLIQEYYVDKYRRNLRLRLERLRHITTAAAARLYVAEVKRKVRSVFHFPETDCPLHPVLAGRIERPEFTLEKIIIESRPGYPVALNLYLPRREGKLPAVLVLCGHAAEGKACLTYQSVAHTLALRGCAALMIDPVEQGERRQWPADGEEPGLCGTHNYLGRQLKALGDNFGSWRIYDVRRALDYLLTRPEVDAGRIGVTGNSGGGTLTTLVSACEDRLAAAAPGCYLTRWLRNVENELPVDAEQIPPGVAADGGEMADLLLAAAPRPLLILGQYYDFFDVRGTREVYEEVRRIYELLGYGDRVRFFAGPDGHGYSLPNRLAAYQFFGSVLDCESGEAEPELKLFTAEETYCLPDGNTFNHPEYKTAQTLIAEQARQLTASRPRLNDAELKTALKKLLRLPAPPVPDYRVLRPGYLADSGFQYGRFALETEPGILAVLHFGIEAAPPYNLPELTRAELYIPHQDGAAELREHSAEPERPLFALDYRGIGETMPATCDQYPSQRNFFAPYSFDYHYDSIAWLLAESMIGKRVYDILCAVEFLYSRGVRDLTISAAGLGTVPAVLAAFLCSRPVKLRNPEPVTTFLEHCESPAAPLPQSVVPAGILQLTDLDELLTRLEREHLIIS